MATETKPEPKAPPICKWCGKKEAEHGTTYTPPDHGLVLSAPPVCLGLRQNFTAKENTTAFIPRRLKLVNGSRGWYLADADTGEDLRLPVIGTMQPELQGRFPNVTCSFIIAGGTEREKR